MALPRMSSEEFLRALTHEPYITCPICRAEEACGTSVIAHHSFTRRCVKCGGNSDGGKLPNLNKKIVYLDQCALGFILRALMHKEGQTKEHPLQVPIVENFLKAFEKLDLLNKKQLLVCPRSEFHFKETALMSESRAEALKKVGILLSSTFSFEDPARMIFSQLIQHFKSWLKGEKSDFNDGKREAVRGNVDEWHSWINVHVNHKITAQDVQNLQDGKDNNNAALAAQFAKWQAIGKKDYDFFRSSEINAVGSLMTALRGMKTYVLPEPSSMLELLLRSIMYPDEFHQFSAALFRACENAGIPEAERVGKIEEYFGSGAVLEVPFFQIASGLTALVAHRAAQNKNMKVDGNHIIDILFMSLFLPYSDAILMEKTWHKDLLTLPLKYKAKVFSVSNMKDFFAYLDAIEGAAPPDVIENVKVVYGDLQPYYTVHT